MTYWLKKYAPPSGPKIFKAFFGPRPFIIVVDAAIARKVFSMTTVFPDRGASVVPNLAQSREGKIQNQGVLQARGTSESESDARSLFSLRIIPSRIRSSPRSGFGSTACICRINQSIPTMIYESDSI